MKESHYSLDMPDDPPGSAELEEIAFNMRRMVVALRFGDPKFSKGDKALEFQNCVEALAIIIELDNKRGRGICFNNMGNALRALYMELAQEYNCDVGAFGRTPHTERRTLQVSRYQGLREIMGKVGLGGTWMDHWRAYTYNGHALDPDGFFRLAVQEEERDLGDGQVSATLATRLLNRALYLISRGDIDEGTRLLEKASSCDEPHVLSTLAWGALAELKNEVHSPEKSCVRDVLLKICDRAEGLLAEKQGNTGIEIALAHSYAELLCVRCFLDETPATRAERAWRALCTIPRMKEQHLRAFAYYVKSFASALAPEIDANLAKHAIGVEGLEFEDVEYAVFGVWRIVLSLGTKLRPLIFDLPPTPLSSSLLLSPPYLLLFVSPHFDPCAQSCPSQ